MHFTIGTEREDDGRWTAEVPELRGVLAYGAARDEAMAKAGCLLCVLSDRIEIKESARQPISIGTVTA